MDRRTFIKGAFGLVVASVGAGIAGTTMGGPEANYIGTSTSPSDAVGPAMREGISLERGDKGFRGVAQGVHLFDVDPIGAELITMADGTRTIDELADGTSEPVSAADVASFFVTLGQGGYLQNEVYVNLTQTIA